MKKALFGILCLGLVAPATAPAAFGMGPPPKEVAVGDDFKLKEGRSATIAGTEVKIRFDRVPADSRCPEGAQCVAAGDARVALTLSGAGESTAELHTNQAPESVVYGGYEISLVALDPYPKLQDRSGDKRLYTATLRASKAKDGAAETMTLGVGQSETAHGMSVRFDRVMEDSRCPEGVNCVWEGNAKIQLTLTGGEGEMIAEINTNTPPRSVIYGGEEIRLVKLDPYPKEGQPIPPESYRATLEMGPPSGGSGAVIE